MRLDLILLTSVTVCVACKPIDTTTAVKSLETSSVVIPYEKWPFIFLHSEPEVCTASAISARLLVTAAHCIEGDYMKVLLDGTKEELATRVDARTLEGWDSGRPTARKGDRIDPYFAAGVNYRSQSVTKLVTYPTDSAESTVLHKAFRATKKGVGVTKAEFWGEDGDRVGALDVAIVAFDRDIFPQTVAIDFDYSYQEGDELVSVGHGRFNDAGDYDLQRREGKVGSVTITDGVIRSEVPHGSTEFQVLTGGDSGGPLLARRRGETAFKLVGVGQSGVLIHGDTVYGEINNVSVAIKNDPSSGLLRGNVWVQLGAPQVRKFLERALQAQVSQESASRTSSPTAVVADPNDATFEPLAGEIDE